MSDNNSANNMSDTSFTTPTNQGIGQVPMTPSPPPRSLVPPPAPKKQIRFNEQIRRIIEASHDERDQQKNTHQNLILKVRFMMISVY